MSIILTLSASDDPENSRYSDLWTAGDFYGSQRNPVKEHARAREGDGSEGIAQEDLER
jgi:hypothetical protein